MTTKIQIEKQVKLQSLLHAYGVKFTSRSLAIDDNNRYTKKNGGGHITTFLSGDVDLDGVFEEEKIDGIVIESTWSDSGFNTQEFPIYRITFQ